MPSGNPSSQNENISLSLSHPSQRPLLNPNVYWCTKNNATVYVIRRLCNKKYLANSKPCTHCQSYLAKFGFKRVKYTDIINGENVLCELRLKKYNN